MFYKKAVFSFIYFLLATIIIFVSIIVISDPYMLFHKKWFHKNQFYTNMRIQDYGLINFEKFDGVILGSSMLTNTSASEASQKLGAHFVNLSIDGAKHFEKYTVLTYALKKKKLKYIITSLDFSFHKQNDFEITFFPKLYSEHNFTEKFKFYIYSNPLKCVFLRDCNTFEQYDPNHPIAWKSKEFFQRRFGGFDNWLKCRHHDQIQDALKILKSDNYLANINLDIGKKIIDTEIIPLFKNREVNFEIIIPPYSILWWKKLTDKRRVLEIYEYLIQQSAKYPNVKIYWFYDKDFPSDISIYKDLTHYHESVNSLQIDAIKNKTNIITTKNYHQKFRDWVYRINHFNIQPYINKILSIK